MMKTFTEERPFGTLLTAMVTPFHEDGSVDFDSAVDLAKRLVDAGNDGLVLNGTTGESPTTHAPEKAELITAIVEAVGDRAHVIAGAGSNDTDHAVRMAEQAQEAGADGLLVVTPYYSRPSQRGIVAHTEAIADSTDLPVMLYDVPGRTGVRYSADTYEQLAAHSKIVAVKDATGDVAAAAELIARTDLAWYCGDDALYLPFLSVGAVGIVSVVAHVAAPELVRVEEHFSAGRNTDATHTAAQLLPLINAIMGTGAGTVMAKAALQHLGHIKNDALRLPQVRATETEIAVVHAALEAHGLLSAAASQ
ncbi:4-hydroxy-tetrahydrodipicolinate synthase [Timonella sp. A28]|uniref:4-hydroxy-tetrahydrodipicolinate synthase n=1 Tax=Timonella sp. A28 TaxID=3442640 RepID=UPI003EBC43AA